MSRLQEQLTYKKFNIPVTPANSPAPKASQQQKPTPASTAVRKLEEGVETVPPQPIAPTVPQLIFDNIPFLFPGPLYDARTFTFATQLFAPNGGIHFFKAPDGQRESGQTVPGNLYFRLREIGNYNVVPLNMRLFRGFVSIPTMIFFIVR